MNERFDFVTRWMWVAMLIGLATESGAKPPNIVVILTDDQGYADLSLNPRHAPEVSTPHMDALAKDGVSFSQGYTSGHVCSPTRAGIMIGGYSQSVGVYTAGDGGRGFDPGKRIFPAFLPQEYVSTAIGKWHLGLDEDFPELKWHAVNRGFDECYKFMGRGGHSYFNLRSDVEGKFLGPIYRNKKRINDEGYLTNRLSEEAVAFIDRNKSNPFFLYLAYNAVHAPAEAPDVDIEAFQRDFPKLSRERAILMAMLKHLDDGVGEVVGKLKREGIFENTLVFFLTDNGGAKSMSADNTPLRGYKQSLDEGGIRTPFIVSWPAKFEGNRTIDTPVISFDILPTVLDALDAVPEPHDFAGKSLLPLLRGETDEHHRTLFWSKGPEDEWAVRRGDWKLHRTRGRMELIDLATDPSETKNLADQHPEQVKALRQAFDDWIATMPDPITGGPKRKDGPTLTKDSSEQRMTAREADRARLREQRRAAKRAARVREKAAAKGKPLGSAKSDEPRGESGAAPGPHPGSRFDLSHWKLTLPVNEAGTYGGHAAEIDAKALVRAYQGPHFSTDSTGAMVFWCPVVGSTTDNTKFPRSELREMMQPADHDQNWGFSGTHEMEARCRVLEVPSNPKVVIGQIHGYGGKARPLVKLQYFKGRIEALVKLSPHSDQDKKLTLAHVELTQEIAWKIKLRDGVLSITVNGATQTEKMWDHDPDWSKQAFYFKAGAYVQDNQGNAEEGARVSFSHLRVSHRKTTSAAEGESKPPAR